MNFSILFALLSLGLTPLLSAGAPLRGLSDQLTREGLTGETPTKLSPPEYMESEQLEKAVLPPIPSVTMGPRFNATKYASSEWIPPDPSGAAGNFSVISVVNVNIEARNKTSGALFWGARLETFFAPVGIVSAGLTDPKIIYDSHKHRFVVVTLDSDFQTYSFILLAVSKNGNPTNLTTSHWHFHKINSKLSINGQTTFADYPGFEVDEEAVYVTNNMYNLDGFFVQSYLWIVNKGVNGGFYDGGAANVTAVLPIKDSVNQGFYQPAEIRATSPRGAGPNIGTYLVAYGGLSDGLTEYLSVVRIQDPLGTPTLTQQFVSIGDIETNNLSTGLPDAPQLGIPDRIEVYDRRTYDAVWHNNSLWCTFHIERNGKTKAYWVKLRTVSSDELAVFADGGAIDAEDIAGSGTSTFYPALAINSRGIVVFGFSASATTIYAGAYVTLRDDVNDPKGRVRGSQVVQEGLAPYKRYLKQKNRWGDYTGASVDPANDNCFWLFNQFADIRNCGRNENNDDGCWGTTWARLCVDK